MSGNGGVGKEHSSRKGVAANEIGTSAVTFEIGFPHRYGLQDRTPALCQPVLEHRKEYRPVALAHGFHHFDRNNVVKPAGLCPIVAQLNLCPSVEACLRIALLAGRNCYPGDLAIPVGSALCKAPPAAPDFQNPLTGTKKIKNSVMFALLCRLKALIGPGKQRG